MCSHAAIFTKIPSFIQLPAIAPLFRKCVENTEFWKSALGVRLPCVCSLPNMWMTTKHHRAVNTGLNVLFVSVESCKDTSGISRF